MRRIFRCLLLLILSGGILFVAPPFQGHTVARTRSAAHSKNKSRSKKKRYRRRRPVGPRLYSGVPLTIISKRTKEISPGVTYTEETVSRNHWRVGIIHADLSADSMWVELRKSKEEAAGMERVEELARRIDSATNERVVAAVNANYWRGGTEDVIGAAVHDGEIVSFDNIKPWSRLQIFNDGTFAITPDSLSVIALVKNYPPFFISRANMRVHDSAVVLYNHYYGTSLPPPPPDTSGKKNIPTDSLHNLQSPKDVAMMNYARDTSELFYETDEDIMPDSLCIIPRSEQYTLKCAFTYIDTPSINATLRCRVVGMSTHTISIPAHGGVLSFPRSDSAMYHHFHSGDTISLECVTSPVTAKPIKEMLMAGPRLVRGGRVSVETDEENFHRKSFIAGSHARTAIGISEDQKEVILLTVDRPFGNRKVGRPGIGLRDLARILVSEGAYDAMNFDGGSSTSLVVNGKTEFPDTGLDFSRHVASAICIMKPKDASSPQTSRR
ncbi:MAG TPA: phosphodiester glycosidase family protein [Candidatus Kapabacteria bacterium]|nr:phosphodiester glycosidase family protein [Candidatus Kapabacteria bacterium]